MNYADLDALHAAIGDNRISARAVAQRILRDLRGGIYEEQLPVTARQQPTASARAGARRSVSTSRASTT